MNLRKEIQHIYAYAYFHGHTVGGTNPSLIEALGSTDLNLLVDVGFNKEVAEDCALYWSRKPGSLAKLIDKADKMSADQTQLALAAVAARAQDFIDHFGIKCNFIRIPRLDRCFNGADLMFHGRQIRKRKSRGNFFLCFVQILFCCRFG